MVCGFSVARLAVDRALWENSRRLEREPSARGSPQGAAVVAVRDS